jgi:hypothetical protein
MFCSRGSECCPSPLEAFRVQSTDAHSQSQQFGRLLATLRMSSSKAFLEGCRTWSIETRAGWQSAFTEDGSEHSRQAVQFSYSATKSCTSHQLPFLHFIHWQRLRLPMPPVRFDRQHLTKRWCVRQSSDRLLLASF